ncbi:MAG: T9SS type A sorting domain-containing protein [Bacteroidetes bacterium]|nr:T9SS type A sorting domain-containing protein [Bacteroidota bacterium]
MKKLFTTLALSIGICAAAFAQNNPLYFDTNVFQSVDGGITNITPIPGSVPGLSPSDSALPCGVKGATISDTIYFKNFTSFSGVNVTSLKIDSLYIPAGLTWHTSSANNTFQGGQDGVILVNGTTNVAQGVYKLRIVVDVNTSVGSFNSVDAEALAHLRYHVRVISDPACPCPAIDPADSASVYTAYTCTVGLNEVAKNITDLSVKPNPFSGSAKIEFNSAVAGTYTLRMTNLLGAVVSSKEVEIYAGQNELMLDRNGLSSGIYLLSISSDKGIVTRKVTID